MKWFGYSFFLNDINILVCHLEFVDLKREEKNKQIISKLVLFVVITKFLEVKMKHFETHQNIKEQISYLSGFETAILRSAEPIEFDENEEISILGQKGIYIYLFSDNNSLFIIS